MRRFLSLVPFALVAQVSVAHAQPQQGAPSGAAEQYPEPPSGRPVDTTIQTHAGVGSDVAYARAGVVELGGYGSFGAASNFTQLTLAPTVGYFIIDNLQISGLLNFTYVNAAGTDSSYFSALAEPSYHLPFSDRLFGFAGVGIGAGYASGGNVGLAIAPRVGANILVGRSGILTPSVSFTYNTSSVVQTSQGNALTVDSLFGANIGYTVMW